MIAHFGPAGKEDAFGQREGDADKGGVIRPNTPPLSAWWIEVHTKQEDSQSPLFRVGRSPNLKCIRSPGRGSRSYQALARTWFSICSSKCPARVTSSWVPWTIRTNLPARISVSYSRALFSGTPKLTRAPLNALRPPTTAAPSSALTIAATIGPAITNGPMPGMRKNALPNRRPHSPLLVHSADRISRQILVGSDSVAARGRSASPAPTSAFLSATPTRLYRYFGWHIAQKEVSWHL